MADLLTYFSDPIEVSKRYAGIYVVVWFLLFILLLVLLGKLKVRVTPIVSIGVLLATTFLAALVVKALADAHIIGGNPSSNLGEVVRLVAEQSRVITEMVEII